MGDIYQSRWNFVDLLVNAGVRDVSQVPDGPGSANPSVTHHARSSERTLIPFEQGDLVSRMRIFTAFTALAACMCLGIGTASAADSSQAAGHSNGSVVSSVDSGNLGGAVNGNANGSQQSATGGGASNAGSTSGVRGNSGDVGSQQSNSNRLASELYY